MTTKHYILDLRFSLALKVNKSFKWLLVSLVLLMSSEANPTPRDGGWSKQSMRVRRGRKLRSDMR